MRFEVGDALDLPVGTGTVDASLALLVLNFVPDADRAVAQMRRVTRPGGVLGAAVWDYGGGMSMLRVLWDSAARLDPTVAGQDEATMPLGRPGGLAELWARAGLEGVEQARSTSGVASRPSLTTGSRSCWGRARPASTSAGCRMPVARCCVRSSPPGSVPGRSTSRHAPGGCAARAPVESPARER